MPEVRLSLDSGLVAARADGISGASDSSQTLRRNAETQFQTVRHVSGSLSLVVGSDGTTRSGRPTDVKADLHWVLERLPNGDVELRPVSCWYEFGKPAASSVVDGLARATGQQRSKRPAPNDDAGANELERQAHLRKEMSKRWDSMLERRQTRVDGESVSIQKEEILEPKKKAPKVAYPEEETLKDETGLRKQAKKKFKARRKLAKGAEQEDAPETANSLQELKAQRGEDGWDFSDGEQFSDDEQDRWDFDDQIQETAAQREEEQPSADEDEAEEAESAALETNHGKEIQVLLRQCEETAAPDSPDDDQDDDDDVGSGVGSAVSSGVGSGTGGVGRPTPASLAASLGGNQASSIDKPAVDSSAQQRRRESKRTEKPKTPKTSLVDANWLSAASPDELRKKIVECLRRQGSSCTPAKVLDLLGIRNSTGTPLFKKVAAALREVTSVEKRDGSSEKVVVLKPQYRE
eukprot:TRINITY_DN6229_c0_g1_i1.p1 TRINITY_DN6229_c0_g1~~TRINITY_DN6229_c0_g1_i1.p1  ORF type:complete len:464 (+),score=130.47 TRINITY_DN6229_c0_g1_i1:80-1471(+)